MIRGFDGDDKHSMNQTGESLTAYDFINNEKELSQEEMALERSDGPG
jgi:hypothetical protein